MRITSCHIDAFGQLRDRGFPELDAPIIVVRGPNETGKSSFYHFLQTMLYGIYPTDETKHPYTPRDGARIRGRLSIETNDGTFYTVSRRLLSSPQGELVKPDGGSTDLRNHTIPVVSHVSREVFEAVYALSLYDLTALSDQGAWQDIQDRLLGSLSIGYIKPARSVAEELDEEASSLWRPDRRGKPESTLIRHRLKELGDQIREAADRDAEARSLSDEIAEIDETLQELGEERVRLGAEKRRMRRLGPVRNVLHRIEEARSEAGDPNELEGFPDDAKRWLEETAARIDEIQRERKSLERRLDEVKETASGLREADRELLARSAEISSWAKRLPALLARVEEAKRAGRAVVEADARLHERAASLLTVAWTDDLADVVGSIARADLRQRVDAYQESARQLESERIGLRARLSSLGEPRRLMPVIALIVTLLAGSAVFFGMEQHAVAFALLLLTAGAAVILYRIRHRNTEIERARTSATVGELERACNDRRERILQLLSGLPLPDGRLDTPDPYLANDITDLQQAFRDREAAKGELQALEDEIESDTQSLEAFVDQFAGLGEEQLNGTKPELVVSLLEKKLDRAEECRAAAEAAAMEVEELLARDEELAEERSRLDESISDMEIRLRSMGEGDVASGLAALARRRTALQRAETYAEDLREVPDLERVRTEIEELEEEGAEWRLSDQEMTRLDLRLDELETQINTLTREQEGKRKDLERILERATVDTLQSEQAQLEADLADLEERRDRLVLLSNIIHAAHHRFRAEHQPDVLRRAGKILRAITGGRYDRLEYEEGTDTLRVYEAGNDFGHVVGAPLSQGTRDQIYLAVRLAIVDHLDEGQERLPVFLDEVFVNWDETRRANCYDIFMDAAEKRQVFIFTCHPWLAEELQVSLPSRIVDLSIERATV